MDIEAVFWADDSELKRGDPSSYTYCWENAKKGLNSGFGFLAICPGAAKPLQGAIRGFAVGVLLPIQERFVVLVILWMPVLDAVYSATHRYWKCRGCLILIQYP